VTEDACILTMIPSIQFNDHEEMLLPKSIFARKLVENNTDFFHRERLMRYTLCAILIRFHAAVLKRGRTKIQRHIETCENNTDHTEGVWSYHLVDWEKNRGKYDVLHCTNKVISITFSSENPLLNMK
jgi:hypothetical protein